MFRPQDRRKCQQLFERYYGKRKFHDALYLDVIRKHLQPGTRVLDAGCGRYLRFCRALSDSATLYGIDLDTVFETDNAGAPFAVRGNLNQIPFPTETFDMIITRSVVEHLEDPPRVFREFARVLRPRGKVVVITPNRWDYVSLIAAATPYRLHRALVSRIFQVPEEDVFPTLYRANTLSALETAFRRAGFVSRGLDAINHYPAYLMFSPVLFRLGVLVERLMGLRALRQLRGSLLGVFEKSGEGSRTLPVRRRTTAGVR